MDSIQVGMAAFAMKNLWESTSSPFAELEGVAIAQKGKIHRIVPAVNGRTLRERGLEVLAEGATRPSGGGRRATEEDPDPYRTCFEVDRDRILHSRAFRRLAYKTQVFFMPRDHQRTRLTHALEVAQVARGIARAVGLNADLAEAIALAHDCGHGPGGHVAEEVFSSYLGRPFSHARFGAEVVLAPMNLCLETLNGVAHHSWSESCADTPEGAVVAWADRIAYLAHDLEDALEEGIIDIDDVPRSIAERLSVERARQLSVMADAMIRTIVETGIIGMECGTAYLMSRLREFNIEKIYNSEFAISQSKKLATELQALLDLLIEKSHRIPASIPGSSVVERAVNYVATMTDRYAERELALLMQGSAA